MLCADSRPGRIIRALAELMDPRTKPLDDGKRRWADAIERQRKATAALIADTASRNQAAHAHLMRTLDDGPRLRLTT